MKKFSLLSSMGLLSFGVWGSLAPFGLTVENRVAPEGLDATAPRFAWKVAAEANARNVRQTAYQIRVATDPAKLVEGEAADLWDSGRVASAEQLNIAYGGRPLVSSQRCWWSVRTWTNDEAEPSAWSRPQRWVTGVMKPADWSAKWIGANEATFEQFDLQGAQWIRAASGPDDIEQCPAGETTYKAVFDVDAAQLTPDYSAVVHQTGFNGWRPTHDRAHLAKRAILAYTADDSVTVWVNGRPATGTVGDHAVADWRWLRFADVAGHLKSGRNEVTVKVRNMRQGPTGLILALVTADGKAPLVTDARWQARQGDAWAGVRVVGPHGCRPWGALKRQIERVAPAFRKTFATRAGVRTATLHITGLGYYEATLDGARIGRKVLDPSPTQYDKRVLYSTYDVTDRFATAGTHRFEVLLGHGYWDVRGIAAWNFDSAPWRQSPCLLAQLELVYDDGTREVVATDASWRQVASPILWDDLRENETISPAAAQRPVDLPVQLVKGPAGKLAAAQQPGSVVVESLKPVEITRLANGHCRIDFGRGVAGWMRLNVRGQKKDDVLVIRSGDMLNDDGTVKLCDGCTGNGQSFLALPGGWFQTDRFVCSGSDADVYEPRFTYSGYRYVEIAGLARLPAADDVCGQVVCTDFPDVGSFTCSNELINRLQTATKASYRGNFVNGYPTDCPHREKNGWTGDAQLASELGMYNFDNVAGYEKWIQDLVDAQRASGQIPDIVPTSGWGAGGGPAWDSVIFVLPWNLYLYKGDRRALEMAYPAMLRNLAFMRRHLRADGTIAYGLGDWVPVKTETSVGVTSTGYFALDLRIAARTAEALGKYAEAEALRQECARAEAAFRKAFMSADGTCDKGTQTAQGTALHQGVLPSADRPAATARLLEAVCRADGHVDFGILGSKYVFRALAENGFPDVAFALLARDDFPSFGHWIKRGATTLWEDFYGHSSWNHIMFGDFSAWLYQYVAGIRPAGGAEAVIGQLPSPADTVAFGRFLLAPIFLSALDHAEAVHDSPRGEIRSAWVRAQDGTVDWTFVIPPNSCADVVVPAGYTTKGRAGRYGSGAYALKLTPTGPQPDPIFSVHVAPKNPSARLPAFELVKAEWGWFPTDGSQPQCTEVTDKLKGRVKGGVLRATANNVLFGDAAPNRVKEVRGVVRVNGKEQPFRVAEDDEIILPLEAAELLKPTWRLDVDAAGTIVLSSATAVTGTCTTVSGKVKTVDVSLRDD